MEIKNLLNTMRLAENLKNNTRHSWTSTGRRESVAEHCWRLTVMAYFMQDEFPEADINKVIHMCMFHDIGEAFTGDIPCFEKSQKNEDVEADCVMNWIQSLPAPYQTKLLELYQEMEAQETLEAKLYKALDKLEVVIQHNEADLSTWIELEYTLNLTHGSKEVEFSNYLKSLREEIKEESLKKIEKDGANISNPNEIV